MKAPRSAGSCGGQAFAGESRPGRIGLALSGAEVAQHGVLRTSRSRGCRPPARPLPIGRRMPTPARSGWPWGSVPSLPTEARSDHLCVQSLGRRDRAIGFAGGRVVPEPLRC